VGKTRIGRKEYNTIQEFKHKIQALKRENDDLRKRLARIKLDEYGLSKNTIKRKKLSKAMIYLIKLGKNGVVRNQIVLAFWRFFCIIN